MNNLPDLDTFLDAPVKEAIDDIFDRQEQPEEEPVKIIPLEEGEIDPRLKLISHSSRTTLHKCPRKYQLYRLNSDRVTIDPKKDVEQGVTFSYGTAVGVGIQSILENKCPDQVVLDTFLSWGTDLLAETPRHKKSFWSALSAVKKFAKLRNTLAFKDYELVIYNGKPAVELSFCINLPNGFKYRGFVDGVLRNTITGEIIVLECKTTSMNSNPAMYKNSGQAIGYSIVLDKLFPDMSSYSVLYLVYESKTREYKQYEFTKSLLQRALWLQELLIDMNRLELYESYDTYPMHGESCFDFYKECEYMGLCTLTTSSLTKPLTDKLLIKMEENLETYQFTVDFNELIESQLEKGED